MSHSFLHARTATLRSTPIRTKRKISIAVSMVPWVTTEFISGAYSIITSHRFTMPGFGEIRSRLMHSGTRLCFLDHSLSNASLSGSLLLACRRQTSLMRSVGNCYVTPRVDDSI